MEPNSPIDDFDTHPEVLAAKARSMAFDLIDIKEAAGMLGRNIRTIRRWERAGKMPKRSKRAREKRYSRADIKAMVAAMSKGTQA
jgi:hypothetical protein